MEQEAEREVDGGVLARMKYIKELTELQTKVSVVLNLLFALNLKCGSKICLGKAQLLEPSLPSCWDIGQWVSCPITGIYGDLPKCMKGKEVSSLSRGL